MKLSTVLLVFALSFVGAAANKPDYTKFKDGGACNHKIIGKTYTDCMASAGSMTPTDDTKACKNAVKNSLKVCGESGSDVELVEKVEGLVKNAVRHAKLVCEKSRNTNCDTLDKHLRASSKGLSDEEKRKEKIKNTAEAGDSATDKVKTCMSACGGVSSCTGVQKLNCSNAVPKEALREALGREPEDWEVKEMVDTSSRKAAGNLLKECYKAATSDQERKDCTSDPTIIQECKLARGGETCSADDLKKGARDVAKKDIDDLMSACVSGKSKQEKKQCRTDNMANLKESVANAMGKDKSNIKDSDVQKVLDDAANDAFSEVMKACGSSDDRKQCQSDAKRAMAEARGEDETDIKDVDIKRESRKAQAKSLAAEMDACMDLAEKESVESAKQAARVKCATTTAKESLKRGSLDGSEPSDKELKEFQNMAAMEAILEARETCEGKCDNKVKAAMAKALGKRAEDVTTFEHRKFEEDAAITSVADEFRACAKAKKDKSDAACKDPIEAFAASSGREEPSDPKKKKTFKKELAKKVVREAEKESVRACMKEATKAEVKQCLEEAKSDVDDVASVAFEGEAADKIQKKKKQVQKKASLSALGDEFRDCFKSAKNDADKNSCRADVESKKELLGVNVPIKHVLKNYRADLLLSPADSCNSTEIKSCRQNAKAEAISNGMVVRAYAQTKKIAEVKGAAEKFASCLDGGTAESDCSNQAKEMYLAISGAEAESYKDKVKTRIEDLGKKIFNGDATKLVDKEAVTVTVETNTGGACNDGVKTGFKDAVKEHVGDGSSSTGEAKKLQGVAEDVGCRVVDDKPEYTVSVDAKGISTDDIDTASDGLATKLSSKAYTTSRRVRRLLATQTTSGAYAAQETTMCSETDTECTGESEGEVSSSASFRSVSVLVGLILCTLSAFVFV